MYALTAGTTYTLSKSNSRKLFAKVLRRCSIGLCLLTTITVFLLTTHVPPIKSPLPFKIFRSNFCASLQNESTILYSLSYELISPFDLIILLIALHLLPYLWAQLG